MKKLFSFIVFLIVLYSPVAFSCVVSSVTEEEFHNASFVGVMKILDRRRESSASLDIKAGVLPRPGAYIYKVQPIQTYIHEQQDVFEVHASESIDCGKYDSDLIESAIFEIDGTLYLKSPGSFGGVHKIFEKYRNETPKSDALQKEEGLCTEQGKKLQYKLNGVFCE